MLSRWTRRPKTCRCWNDSPSGRPKKKICPRRHRRVAFKSAAIATMLVLITAMLNAQNKKFINSVEDRHFHMVAADSPIFQTELSSILDVTAVGQVASVLPHSIIATNDTGERIWSFTIVYTYPQEISESGQPRRFIVSQAASIRSSTDQMLAPGDKYFITPVRNCTAMSRPGSKVSRRFQFTPAMSREIDAYKERDIDSNRQVEVSVDSVIFEDGEIIGPDIAGRQASVNARIDADRSLFDSLAALQGDRLRDYLKQTSGRTVITGEYDMYLTSMAAHFLAILDAQGEPALHRFVSLLKSVVPFQNNRIARRTQP